MRKSLQLLAFSFFLLSFFVSGKAYGFDIKGLQPVEPYGIFSTFSAESFGKGHGAVSAGTEISAEPDFFRVTMKTAYGLLDNLEIGITAPYVSGSDTDGFEDVAIGIKHRFFDEGKYGPSLAYIIGGSLPTGRKELSTDGRLAAGIVVSKRVGPFNGHLNLFCAFPGKGKLEEEISMLAGLDFAAANNFKLLAELYTRKSHDKENIDLIEGRFGYRIRTTDFIYTTIGAGYDFKNRNPEYRIFFSVSFLYPPERKEIRKIYEEE
jgi:hypothetical protein